ncbi:MAG: hypothetical protein RDV48_30295 [Candidatus Eremiobacteraeota bacterium]|nr:hypothetical protein [Candidatus Eremiobacteraeota bacterium]
MLQYNSHAMKITCDIPVEPGQPFVIDNFRPSDAEGIARLFCSEYGAAYPVETYYYPEQIIEEHEKGNIFPVVARTPRGDIIGHGSLYRSSPPFEGLFETGQYIVRKDYRTTFAAYTIHKHLMEKTIDLAKPRCIYGEAVCTILASQKLMTRESYSDMALEPGLMPGSSSRGGESPRVSCLMQFRTYSDRPHEVFIPTRFTGEIMELVADGGFERTYTRSEGVPLGSTVIEGRLFPGASVGRFQVHSASEDFNERVREIEEKGKAEGIKVFQYFVNLGTPSGPYACEVLARQGCFFAGYLPRWFDSDGLLMMKTAFVPDFEGIQLYTEKARRLLALVRGNFPGTG